MSDVVEFLNVLFSKIIFEFFLYIYIIHSLERNNCCHLSKSQSCEQACRTVCFYFTILLRHDVSILYLLLSRGYFCCQSNNFNIEREKRKSNVCYRCLGFEWCVCNAIIYLLAVCCLVFLCEYSNSVLLCLLLCH